MCVLSCESAQLAVTLPAGDPPGVTGCKPPRIEICRDSTELQLGAPQQAQQVREYDTVAKYTHAHKTPLVFWSTKGGGWEGAGNSTSPNSCPATSRLQPPDSIQCVFPCPRPVVFLPSVISLWSYSETFCVRHVVLSMNEHATFKKCAVWIIPFIACSRPYAVFKWHSVTVKADETFKHVANALIKSE